MNASAHRRLARRKRRILRGQENVLDADFTLRRCQILTASAEELKLSEICSRLGCSTQTVRNALRA